MENFGRAVTEFKAGRIEQAIILMQANHLPTGAFCDAVEVDYQICFPRRCVNFSSSVFKVSSAIQPSVIIGIGIGRERFDEHFGALGKTAFVAGRQ